MSDPDILERIDATLDDYEWDGDSPDAARWAGGPTEGEWGDQLAVHHPRNWVAEYDEQHLRFGLPSEFTFPQRVIVGAEHAEQIVRFGSPEPPTARARLDAIEEMAQACGLTMTEWQRVVLNQWLTPTGRECWKCRRWHYGDGLRCDTCWPKQLPRPMAAAERTSSPRRRAGSRRTKRQARRRHG